MPYSGSPELSIVHTSDDPRRGGRLKHSDNRRTEICPPNVFPHKQAPKDVKGDDLHSAAGGETNVLSGSNMVISSKMSEICPSPTTIKHEEDDQPESSESQKTIKTPEDELEDDLLSSTSSKQARMRQGKETQLGGV